MCVVEEWDAKSKAGARWSVETLLKGEAVHEAEAKEIDEGVSGDVEVGVEPDRSRSARRQVWEQ